MKTRTTAAVILLIILVFMTSALVAKAETPPTPSYTYRATVLRVKDGDTITVNIDLGFKTWQHDVPLRLNRLYVPETFQPKSEEERAAGLKVKAFVVVRLAEGKQVVVTTLKDKQEKYGRFLAEVWDDKGNVNDAINKFMADNDIKTNKKGR